MFSALSPPLPLYRVGSQFQLRVGVSLNGLDDVAKGNLANDSLLFRTSNRTAFFLGGWPEGAQVAQHVRTSLGSCIQMVEHQSYTVL